MQPGQTITPRGLPAPSDDGKLTLSDTKMNSYELGAVVHESGTPQGGTDEMRSDVVTTASQFIEPQLSKPIKPISDAPDLEYEDSYSWTASEFIAHNKTMAWFIVLAIVIATVSGVVFLITKDIVAAVTMGILGIAFGFYAARPPRILNYRINKFGINIGEKFFPYERFKFYSLIEDDKVWSIILSPMQRFMPIITIYFEDNAQEKIVNLLSDHLPYEEAKLDTIDIIMHKLRF
ncbi:MAG: hypothetical protein NVS1B7_1820 [Candidatus Saccharimonadales bacterium]